MSVCVYIETLFQDLEVKRLYHPDPSSSAKPSPPDLRFEERNVGNQFSVASGRLYEWNIDGLSSQVLKFKIKAALKDRQRPILWPRPT